MTPRRQRSVRFAVPPQPSEEDLRLQLEELRESTRAALLESWEEVEKLQIEKQEYLERSLFLQAELESAKERESELRDIVAKLTQKAATNTSPRSSITSKLFRSRSENNGLDSDSKSVGSAATGRSVSSSASSTTDGGRSSNSRRRSSDSSIMRRAPSENKLEYDGDHRKPKWWSAANEKQTKRWQEERELMEQEMLMQMTELEREKNKLINEWQVRVKCRDSALETLEKTQKIQSQTVEFLRKELDSLKTANAHKEVRYAKDIERLRAKLDDRKEIIQKQATRLEDCQQYIAELTEELEKVCRVSPSAVAEVSCDISDTEHAQHEGKPVQATRSPSKSMPPIEVRVANQDNTPAA